MITFFNKIGNSWIARIICAALAISMMAFWGLGGLSSGFSGDNKAITIDSDVITIEQINQKFNQERSKISALTGQNLSTQQAIGLGLLERTIQQSITEELSKKISDEIGLIASDEAVRKYVERNPLFQNSLGNFDAKLFNAYMGQLKMNQTQLAEQLKQELTSQHLSHPLSKVPQKSIIDSIALTQKEKREVSAIFLATKEIEVGSPDASALKDYYEAYQEEFTTPEYRQIQLLSVMPAHFKGNKEQAYDKMYQTIQDLEDLLGEGTSLKEATQKLDLQAPVSLITDISGKNSAATVADKKLENNPILQEIFTLSEHEATSITDYENGFLVAEVEKIIPVSQKPYEAVKEQVRTLWKTEQQKEKLPELAQKVVEQVKHSNAWGRYIPTHETIERTQSKHIPSDLLSKIYTQKLGYENIQSYPVQEGTWIVVVHRIVPDSHPLSEQDKKEARELYTQDLLVALQKAYAENWNIQINETAINKFFSQYSKEEE